MSELSKVAAYFCEADIGRYHLLYKTSLSLTGLVETRLLPGESPPEAVLRAVSDQTNWTPDGNFEDMGTVTVDTFGYPITTGVYHFPLPPGARIDATKVDTDLAIVKAPEILSMGSEDALTDVAKLFFERQLV